MKIIIGILVVLILYVIWQYQELKKFKVTAYEIDSDKLHKEVTIAVVADLHSKVFGQRNEPLFASIREQQPDLIVVPGDLITAKHPELFSEAVEVLKEFKKIAPVYYVYGNHEGKDAREESAFYVPFTAYLEQVKKAGITVVENEHLEVKVHEEKIGMTGLVLGQEYYSKKKRLLLSLDEMRQYVDVVQESPQLELLLAHTPAHSKTYAKAGYDVTFCGHYHGGLVRIPGFGSVISPQFEWFPKYSGGIYEEEGRHIVVSRGLGTHTFHIRVFNRAELVVLRIKGTA